MKVYLFGKSANGGNIIERSEEMPTDSDTFKSLRQGRMATGFETLYLPVPAGHSVWRENHQGRLWAFKQTVPANTI